MCWCHVVVKKEMLRTSNSVASAIVASDAERKTRLVLRRKVASNPHSTRRLFLSPLPSYTLYTQDSVMFSIPRVHLSYHHE